MSEYMRSQGPEKTPKAEPSDALFEMADFEEAVEPAEPVIIEEMPTKTIQAARSIIENDQSKELSEEVGPAERLMTLRERFGFIPRSTDELNDAWGIVGRGRPAGAASYLNEIFQHQQKSKSEDPSAAVRSITTSFIDYAKEAYNEKEFIDGLLRFTSDTSNRVDFSHLGRDWQENGSLSRPLIHALWTIDAHSFMREESENNPLKEMSPGKRYNPSRRDTLEAIQTMMENKRTSLDLVDALRQSKADEERRLQFWKDRLGETIIHRIAAPVAHRGLREIYALENPPQ